MGVGERRVRGLLASAGVEVDGPRPWDIQVHDRRTYRRVALHGLLGAGESYMDGWWDCERLDDLACRLSENGGSDALERSIPGTLLALKARLRNLDRPRRAFKVAKAHYDIGNDLYERMLDRRMVYSCGYWRDAYGLDAAQEAKLELACRKMHLEPGMRVLDIGCGWGSLAQYAAQEHSVHVTGLTVSKQQATLARQRCKGLDVDIHLQDYRRFTPTEPYDRIVSIGMFEHVGHKNHRAFMEAAHQLLRPDGLMLLHTIGTPESTVAPDPWTHRYIFPNGHLPSMAQIGRAADGLLYLEDLHGFGQDYDPTLMAWHANIERAWGDLEHYSERFRRMWRYYLLTSAGAFRARRIQVWQMVFSPDRGVPGGYEAVR